MTLRLDSACRGAVCAAACARPLQHGLLLVETADLTGGQQPAQLQCAKSWPAPQHHLKGSMRFALSPTLAVHMQDQWGCRPQWSMQTMLSPRSLVDPEDMPLTHRLCNSVLHLVRPAAAQGCLGQCTPTGNPPPPGFHSGTVH